MKSSNPVLNNKAIRRAADSVLNSTGTMTVQGTVSKTYFLLFLCSLSATIVWYIYNSSPSGAASVTPLIPIGAICGFILAIVTAFKTNWANVTAPTYAIFEGLFLGALSAMIDSIFPGIVLQATALTFAVLLTMLIAYRTGMIRATEKFKSVIVAATGGIALVYLVSIIMSFFGVQIPYIHQGGTIGIGFSLFVITIAALNFILDFDFIEEASRSGAPKVLEWYGAMGILITLVWLYLEIVRLLIKLRSND
jgi:uncharacterized YccA/Bax inhibitor family protein